MFSIQKEAAASVVRAWLPDAINGALDTSPAEEQADVTRAGQLISEVLEGVADDHVVRVQTYGSNTPNVGARTVYLSVEVKPIEGVSTMAKKTERPKWTPKPSAGDASASASNSAATPRRTVPGDATK